MSRANTNLICELLRQVIILLERVVTALEKNKK